MLCIRPGEDQLSQIELERIVVLFSTENDKISAEIEYQIQPQVPPIKVQPLFNKHSWLEEGWTKHKPQTRIELDFKLASGDSNIILVNDTQVLERLQMYRNGRLFSSGYDNSAARMIQLSIDDLETFKQAAYLGFEPLQTYNLIFVDFENMWHQLFSVTFEVEEMSLNEKRLGRKAKQSVSNAASIELITNQKGDIVTIGLETLVSIVLVRDEDGQCLQTPQDYNLARDLDFQIYNSTELPGTQKRFRQKPIINVFVNGQEYSSICRQRIQAKILIKAESLIDQNIVFSVEYRPLNLKKELELRVRDRVIDFSKTEVKWLSDNSNN